MRTLIFFAAIAVAMCVAFSVAAGYDENQNETFKIGSDSDKPPIAFDKKPAVGTEATCPVMGHSFKIKADNAFSEYKGKFYFFCCPGCKPKFDADPTKYINKG